MSVRLAGKARIMNALLALIQAGPFYPITYDPDTGEASLGVTGVSPKASYANSTHSEFDITVRNRQKLMLERSAWEWEVLAAFDQEVSFEDFEEKITEDPLVLPRTTEFPRQVTFLLKSTDEEHPTQQDSSSGSRVKFTFQVELSPQ